MMLGYWVQWINDADDAEVKPLLGLPSAVDAAGLHAQSLVEASEGAWTGGAIRVWTGDQGPTGATIFDVRASFVPSEDDDAEEGDLDCELEIVQRD